MNSYQDEKYKFESTDTQVFEVYERAINELPPIIDKRKKKKSKLVPLFSTFLAGAILVASMSFVADYFKWFTPDNVAAKQVYDVSSGQVQPVSHTSELTVADMYKQVSEAVVKIESYNSAYTRMNTRQGMFYIEPRQSDMQLSGSGTGYIFETEGYLLTNEHVIHGAQHILVTVPGYEEPFTAQVVGSSEELDIAVLKIEPLSTEGFSIVPLGDSSMLDIGEWVIAIGNPYGYDYTMTMGVISAMERPITIQNENGELHTFEHMLQTDASINPGNSGGPLIDENGQVIGMNTAVSVEAQGIGFAIPINEIKTFLQTITVE